jgi:hypothetical protein
LKKYFEDRNISSNSNKGLWEYINYSYKDFEYFISDLQKAVSRGEGKISKTFVVSNGTKRFIDRASSNLKIKKSTFFEFLIRSEYSREIGIKLDRAKKYYGIFLKIREELESAANLVMSARNRSYDLLKDHHLDRDAEIFYPELMVLSNYREKGYEPIQVAMGNLEVVEGMFRSDVIGPIEDAIEEEKAILEKSGLAPEDYMFKKGGER